MRYIYHLSTILLLSLLVSACGADAAMKKGDRFYSMGEYYDAATQYKKAYAQTSPKERKLRGQRALKMADCYRRINHNQRSIAAYNNGVRYRQACAQDLYYLGLAEMKNGAYRNAEKTFQQVLDSLAAGLVDDKAHGDSLTYKQLLALALEGQMAAKNASALKAKGSKYTVKRQDLFNSRRSEYSPALCGDDYDQLYFASTRNQAEGDEYSGISGVKPADIFFSQKDEQGRWQKPEQVEGGLNTALEEGTPYFSPDNRTMYITACPTDPVSPRYAQIATSQRSDASWGAYKLLTVSKDTLSLYAHPAVTPDGQWLYFTSNMPGGVGGLDIWRAPLYNNGDVGPVENLGRPINTDGDEEFPTFRPNGDLYFSSNGHPGLGGLDIIIAQPDTTEESGWKLEHPGYPLNSQGDDFGMTFEGLYNRGFFCSNRGDARGWDHIFSFEKSEIQTTVKGWVYERDGYELTQALVFMVGDDGTNLRLSVRGDGSFQQELEPGVNYVFLGTCKGFLNHKEELHVEHDSVSREYVLQFPLANIKAPVLIDNIHFDFAKATLRLESELALDTLVRLLEDNPNITIELSAHTDNRGSDEYNQRLSQARAESVVAYLIKQGIKPDRLTPVGYGEAKPKTVRRRLTERYPWLKVDDVLTEDFINALKDEEQREICHQLNRRTEFLVLRTTYGMFEERKTTANEARQETSSPEKARQAPSKKP